MEGKRKKNTEAKSSSGNIKRLKLMMRLSNLLWSAKLKKKLIKKMCAHAHSEGPNPSTVKRLHIPEVCDF